MKIYVIMPKYYNIDFHKSERSEGQINLDR